MSHWPNIYHNCFSNPSAGNHFTKKKKRKTKQSHKDMEAIVVQELPGIDVSLCSGRAICHPGPVHNVQPQHLEVYMSTCSPTPACFLSHLTLHSSFLISIYPSLALLLIAVLNPEVPQAQGCLPHLSPLPNGPVLTGFALLSRQLLLRFLLLLLHQPHFLQQAHQAAAQGDLFLWFLLLPLQLNSWRWSRMKGVSLSVCYS